MSDYDPGYCAGLKNKKEGKAVLAEDIPADRKWFARAAIADIIARRIGELGLQAPVVSAEQAQDIRQAREELGI